MRTLLLLATLPVLAGTPSRGKAMLVKITRASVTWGAGVEPKGAVPPAQFHADVQVVGVKEAPKLEVRAWRVLVSDLAGLERGANLRFVRGGLGRLEAKATPGPGGTFTLAGTWPGAPQAEERLVVEVWRGNHRLGYAVAPLEEHAIPTGRPRQGQEGN